MEFWKNPNFWFFIINALSYYSWFMFIYYIITLFVPASNRIVRTIGILVVPVVRAFEFARIKIGSGQYLDLSPLVAYLAIRYILIEAAYRAYLLFCN